MSSSRSSPKSGSSSGVKAVRPRSAALGRGLNALIDAANASASASSPPPVAEVCPLHPDPRPSPPSSSVPPPPSADVLIAAARSRWACLAPVSVAVGDLLTHGHPADARRLVVALADIFDT